MLSKIKPEYENNQNLFHYSSNCFDLQKRQSKFVPSFLVLTFQAILRKLMKQLAKASTSITDQDTNATFDATA